jgi:alkanesulfonate monooxygenase SsuD/methylene tetrahydromethanopterin reductase-like flavin-dependent oxidoreductase (luciferase family)
VAQQTADIAQLAPGRFVLGLGPSHAIVMEGRYGIPYRQPLGHLREFVTVMKGLLTGAQTDFEGKHFKVHAKLNYGAQVPIIISALRATSFELAGEISERRDRLAPLLPARCGSARARTWRRATG